MLDFVKEGSIKNNAGYFLLLAILLVGSGILFLSEATLEENQIEYEEAMRPANLEFILITTPECADCFDVQTLANTLYSQPVEVTDEERFAYDSTEGQVLIDLYDIKFVPSLIIKGETDKEIIASYLAEYTTAVDDALVWTTMKPPYISTETGNELGRVSITLITDSSCDMCYDSALHKKVLEGNFGMSIAEEKRVDIRSQKGAELVQQYAITDLPTVVISSGAKLYTSFEAAWGRVGTTEPDGSYVFRNMGGLGQIIYKNLETGKVIDTANKN